MNDVPDKRQEMANPFESREFVLAATRTARTRLLSMVYELDEIGVAIKYQMLPLDDAVSWMDDLGALRYVNVVTSIAGAASASGTAGCS